MADKHELVVVRNKFQMGARGDEHTLLSFGAHIATVVIHRPDLFGPSEVADGLRAGVLGVLTPEIQQRIDANRRHAAMNPPPPVVEEEKKTPAPVEVGNKVLQAAEDREASAP